MPGLIDEIFSERLDAPDDVADWLERYRPPSPKQALSPDFLHDVALWMRENRTRLVFFMFARMIDPERAGLIATGQAECVIRLVYETLQAEMDAAGGQALGRGLALIALGDFGGRELSPAAPIDLAFVYDPEGGEHGQMAARYNAIATRIAQALMGEMGGSADGAILDIDTRKRPGGAGGDIATDINLYLNFYQNESHPDEHVALTRARVICAPQALRDRLEAAIGECVTRPRKVERLMVEADKGRTKQMRRNRPASIWDLERIRGGLGDLTFIAEIMQVRFGAMHPYILATGTGDALSALARAGCIDPDTATDLAETYLFFSRLRTILHLTGVRDLSRERPRQRLQSMISRAAGVSSFGSVEPLIHGHAERVQAHYKRLILGDESATPLAQIVAA
jgi:glutamate-ammonia-ligase adenylyltransferase